MMLYDRRRRCIGSLLDSNEYPDMEIAEIDGFRSREKDHTILSCVQSNSEDKIGFLKNHRGLEFALTRAWFIFLIVGYLMVLCTLSVTRSLAPLLSGGP